MAIELARSEKEVVRNIVQFFADPEGYVTELWSKPSGVKGWYIVRSGQHWAFGPSRIVRYSRKDLLRWLREDPTGSGPYGGTPGAPKKDHLVAWFDEIDLGEERFSGIKVELSGWLQRHGGKLNRGAKAFLLKGTNTKPAKSPREPTSAERLSAMLVSENQVMSRRIQFRGRSASVREHCIKYHQHRCFVCALEFGIEFGSEFDGLIEVHHEKPLSHDNKIRVIDPIKDCKPLCPNCHRLAHFGMPRGRCRSIKQLKKIWRDLSP